MIGSPKNDEVAVIDDLSIVFPAIKAIEGAVSQVHMINGNTEHAVLLELLTVGGVGTLIEGS